MPTEARCGMTGSGVRQLQHEVCAVVTVIGHLKGMPGLTAGIARPQTVVDRIDLEARDISR